MNTQKRNSFIFLVVFIIFMALPMLACDDGTIENYQPVAGDSRTIGQMSDEVKENVEDIPNNMGFNAVWSR